MSVEQGSIDATRHNVAMAVAGFLMTGTIVGAGLAGFAVGRAAATPSVIEPADSSAAVAIATPQLQTSTIAISIKSDSVRPGTYTFSPAAIAVRSGQKVTLLISNPGAAMHGIAIPEFGVNTMIQPAGHGHASMAQASFTPTKPGVYIAHCIVYCGPGHADMTLRITVTA